MVASYRGKDNGQLADDGDIAPPNVSGDARWDFAELRLTISGDGVDVPPALREYVIANISRAFSGLGGVSESSVRLSASPNDGDVLKAKFTLHIDGFVLTQEGRGRDTYTAVDNMMKEMETDPIFRLDPHFRGEDLRMRLKDWEEFMSLPSPLSYEILPSEDATHREIGEGVRALQVLDYRALYMASASARINMIKSGVPAADVARLARSMDSTTAHLSRTLSLALSTVDRKARAQEMLSAEHSEKVVGLAKLIGQVQTMVEESGDPRGFNAAHWVSDWLDSPLPALGGKCPADYMDTAEGRELVGSLLMMMQSGAYA